VRVGSFSNLDKLYPHNRLAKAASPFPLPKAAAEATIGYRFENRTLSVDDFLQRQRVTGLLIVKDGEILLERYQYDRMPTHRFLSHSMAKSLVCLAIGLALAEGKIVSLDDKVSKYVPQLAGNPYGETSIRNILRMASGVQFKEVYDGKDDIARFVRIRISKGAIEALRAFTVREAREGTRFHYASSETVVLALVVRAVTGKTLSEYLTERLWQPMGAEADATWIRDIDGLEAGMGNFNAVLRDYGRLGVLLANDGAVGGKQILPKTFLLEATDWRKQPAAFAPGRATPYFGYGYQFWLFPGAKRRFALLGVYGQSIFVDPELKLVMAVTAVAKTASVGKEPLSRERNALWRGLVARYGSW
jgi:CubicO group peptidase (beta-lactamase class C family)